MRKRWAYLRDTTVPHLITQGRGTGLRGRWEVSAQGAVHMEAALAGYKNSLDWHWVDYFSPCQHKRAQEPLPSPCRGTISGLVGNIQSGEVLGGWRALTIESLLMSGCGQGHEPKATVSKKLQLKFPVLALSRSGNTSLKRYPQKDSQ